MKKVIVNGPALKLNGKWCYDKDTAIISEDVYEKNKKYLRVIESISDVNVNKNIIEIEINNEIIDIKDLKEKLQEYAINYIKEHSEDIETTGEDIENTEESTEENAEENTEESTKTTDSEEHSEDIKNIKNTTLEELRAQAKELGVKNTHLMGKDKLVEKINELTAPKFGENEEL